MKYLFVFLLSTIYVQSFEQTIINDKNAEVRDVSPFTAINVSGGIEVYLSQSDNYTLAVSTSGDKHRNEITTQVTNGVLNISGGGGFQFNSNQKFRVYVSFKTLEKIEASGASDFIINETLKANSLKLRLSGAGEIKGAVDIDNFDIGITGASVVNITGAVRNLKIEASGASDVKGYDLVVDNCSANLSGASDINVTINKSVSAKATGASSLNYKGNPERNDIRTSGASSISQKD